MMRPDPSRLRDYRLFLGNPRVISNRLVSLDPVQLHLEPLVFACGDWSTESDRLVKGTSRCRKSKGKGQTNRRFLNLKLPT